MTEPLLATMLVGVGGALGASARHAVGLAIDGRESVVVVNAAGSLVLGGVLAAPLGSAVTLAVAVGFCGAFTTFSSFAVETVTTADGGEIGVASGFAVTNLVAAVLALLAGSGIVAAIV
ncbi:fluoride efflux transporter FluC [Halorubrum sp. DTA98]|uniref:fluoride efflux transporter FluC n=1 Tax=Halorubrum sp. DTA98 TaxID=3402163 RepID=UPI003AB035FC